MTSLPKYTRWDDVPEGYYTKTKLTRLGLKPAKDQNRVGIFYSSYYKNYYDLYDINEAIPKRKMTPGQKTSLDKAREEKTRRSICHFCKGNADDYSKKLKIGVCRRCSDRRKMAQWAVKILDTPGVVILDTETTGLGDNDEIIEISIINTAGEVLLDSLVKPTAEIEPGGAIDLHGISNEMVANAPTFSQIWPTIKQILSSASAVVIYNKGFDVKMLYQSYCKAGLEQPPPIESPYTRGLTRYYSLTWYWAEWSTGIPHDKFNCAMEAYAQWYGEWSNYHQSYRWQPLSGGHRALGDCLACLELIKQMADSAKRYEVNN